MFNNIGWGEILMLGILALLIFGPERLPGIARQAGKAVREFRQMASTATSEIRDGLGDDVADLKNLRNLHPRTWLNEELGDLRGDLGGTPRGNGGPAATTAQRPDRTLAAGAAPPYDPEAT